MFDAGKTRMIGLPCGEKNYDDVKPFHRGFKIIEFEFRVEFRVTRKCN